MDGYDLLKIARPCKVEEKAKELGFSEIETKEKKNLRYTLC
jgi:hypothetical protein